MPLRLPIGVGPITEEPLKHSIDVLGRDTRSTICDLKRVDIYQQAERAVKYAALFVVLTFVVFFLFEVVRARLLHPDALALVMLLTRRVNWYELRLGSRA